MPSPREIDRVLIPRDRIAARVREMAARIAEDLRAAVAADGHSPDEGHRIVLMPVMTGAIVFTADLIREMPLRLSLELVTVSSYPGQSTESRGATLAGELRADIAGKHVLLIDDILDSGRTLDLLRGIVESRGPASVRSAVLLDKKARRAVPFEADYVGFEIPDEFVVGYGLDVAGRYRNLPFVAVVKPDAVLGK